ncbi:MAG: O-sialoglycoprotein endopeptidase [Clostridia bacterium]|nr:O-sialoglycoprotein endopeptidase [Clostridia bacterium]
MPDTVLGIDTSCYTTSAALVSGGRIINSQRRLLEVDVGERGLRQSEGVFRHMRALPELLEELLGNAYDERISAVCASSRPRPEDDSYMPVFMVGASFARSIGACLGVPVYYTSHQQGHVRAALVDTDMPAGKFLALHLSGGTTQLLLVNENLDIRTLGGTNDLNAGQLVDRTGVYMGLRFPCGPELEKLALCGKSASLIPVSQSGDTCSFSGAENKIKQLLAGGCDKCDVAAEVYSFLARTIARMISRAVSDIGVKHVLLAGGVASSGLLRRLLPLRLNKLASDVALHWARSELSGDNACGCALIGEEMFMRGKYGDNN